MNTHCKCDKPIENGGINGLCDECDNEKQRRAILRNLLNPIDQSKKCCMRGCVGCKEYKAIINKKTT